MRYLFGFLTMTLVALGVGFSLTYFAVTGDGGVSTFRFGSWIAWPAVGAPSPDPYTRAHMARFGTLVLGRSEGIEFVASTDEDGEPLTPNCTYRIEGRTPVATFWTLYAATPDGENIARSEQMQAVNSTRLVRNAEGDISVYVGPTLAPGNWLEIRNDGPSRFQLILSLYDAAVFSGLGSDVTALPQITKESCA